MLEKGAGTCYKCAIRKKEWAFISGCKLGPFDKLNVLRLKKLSVQWDLLSLLSAELLSIEKAVW